MRKFLAFSIMMIGLLGMQAQNSILNSDFELWSYGKPVNWTVDIHGSLTGAMTIPLEVHFGEQTSDAHTGNSAIKVASADATSSVISYTMNLPGFLQAGESDGFSVPFEDALVVFNMLQDSAGIGNIVEQLDSLDLSALATFFKVFSKGVPCESTPHSVTAWVKYQPQEGDQMALFIMTKKNGELVDYAFDFFAPENPNQYYQIGVNFNTPGAECDSIMVIFTSATQMNSNSVLYVDDVALNYNPDGLDSYNEFPGKVYPNPATDRICVHPYNALPYEWILTDMTGKTIQAGKADGNITIDTRYCATGLYLLRLNGDGISDTRKVMIR
ncbi:MAG: T9SS type A sorting domain-containing protein [Bacteroidales bacterium]|nr:T9SS type A sorting domain-containing protein [Bacteroidales bacterium]